MPWASGDNLDSTNLNNTIPSWNVGPSATDIQYVSTTGDDSNDGLTWATAKASVAAAVAALPLIVDGDDSRRSGRVEIGPGDFTETALPIELVGDIALVGANTKFAAGKGTRILMGADAHLFDSPAAFTDWGHHLLLQDLTLDGNTRTGAFDLFRCYRGGFNTSFRRVHFRDAPRHGLTVEVNANNVFLYDCSFADCLDAAMYFQVSAGAANFMTGIFGCQADNNEGEVILVDYEGDGDNNNFVIVGLKCEANIAGTHEYIIRHRPISGSSNGMHYQIFGIAAQRSGGIGAGTAILYEEDLAGQRATWAGCGVHSDGASSYPNAFISDKSGATNFGADSSVDHELGIFNFGIRTSNSESRIELGRVQILSGFEAPENNFAARPGSIYLRHAGGTSTTFYAKETGSGNTGWIAK